MTPVQISRALARKVNALHFAPPVTHVYNPLDYARKPHERYLERFAATPKEVLFLGMNPGPFGMAQTGVPFGDVTMVRDWIGIEEPVQRPGLEHTKRPVDGFACSRSEVSGTRLWGWARDRFNTPERFFDRFFVWNYCPLCFMEASGRNRTPDKMPKNERLPLFEACDEALVQITAHLKPAAVIGIGAFAEHRARHALGHMVLRFGRIPHPSPASPQANRSWAQSAEDALVRLGILHLGDST